MNNKFFHFRGSLRAHRPDQRGEGGEGRLRARRLLLGGDDRRPWIVQGGRRGIMIMSLEKTKKPNPM